MSRRFGQLTDKGVLASTSQPEGDEVRALLAVKGERVGELAWTINRAINTYPEAPKWLFELADLLDAAK